MIIIQNEEMGMQILCNIAFIRFTNKMKEKWIVQTSKILNKAAQVECIAHTSVRNATFAEDHASWFHFAVVTDVQHTCMKLYSD
ncbi:hypothetical protein Tsp_12399 [Trichinella spiralis]|uniref:hypothetical protein n=1 Tax=Trichinella spiralis TaxID=6334 RepID=UPI0001EFDE44|nr:hypothetical protein Tsp_12399 [Trichinella spiralis]